MEREHTYLECACNSDEHVLHFRHDPEDNELYLSVYLNHYLPWYKRIIPAFRHILGYKGSHGDFDCTILNEQNVDKLAQLCERVKTRQKEIGN